jgi:LmbE family N-acetylglucosaminyl deacetylase
LGVLLCAPVASTASAPSEEHPDESFRFAASFSATQPIALTRTSDALRFEWPTAKVWDTALLEVHSEGAEHEPYVEINAGATRLVQYLDPNATGTRWLNLSGLRGIAPGTSVTLQAHAVTLSPNATLRWFDNRLDLRQPILIIAPHPDDAEIAAFGLYADRASTIVTVTAGNAGDMNYRAEISDPADQYRMKGYLRAVDSVTVPWQGGVPPARTFNLGYFDARLDAMYDAPDRVFSELYGPNEDVAVYRRANLGVLLPTSSRTNSWRHLVEDLTTVLKKVNPAIIVMPDPRIDGHADHEFATVAVAQALEHWQGSARFLLYANHVAKDHYPYGPAGTVMSLPPVGPLMLQGVYSHPTPSALRIRKIFALESMHDLRLSPEEQRTCGIPGIEHRPDYPRQIEVDYLRRAPRDNELFYVFDREGLGEVIRDFLESRKTSPPSPP